MSEAAAAVETLLALMRQLRDPHHGCPWDREQSAASLAPFTIEEAYEVVDAIGRTDPDRLRDELGDLLFQIVFHARLAEEQGRFDFAAVARGIADKLIRRHPHVFSDPKVVGLDELHVSWEAQKAHERAAGGARGALADVPIALPALARAAKLGRRARRVGFDWDSAPGVRAKLTEELAEIDDALQQGRPQAIAEEIGDLLFTIANWARHLEIDAEDALRIASLKFERRFEHMEHAAAARGLALERLSAVEWEELWSAAKAALARGPQAGGR
jgi:nucleoside triphosphate diphosphatase